jgi:hypothetical protein
MKKIFKVMTLIAVMSFTGYQVFAQPAPGVQSGSGPVLGGPIGGGAPIGSGLTLLITLGIVYGANKLFLLKKISQVN